jgi:hypothetical protein
VIFADSARGAKSARRKDHPYVVRGTLGCAGVGDQIFKDQLGAFVSVLPKIAFGGLGGKGRDVGMLVILEVLVSLSLVEALALINLVDE